MRSFFLCKFRGAAASNLSKQGSRMRIAFLGLGNMGSAIARLLVENGHDLTVWNRTESAAVALAKFGAVAANTAAEAVYGVDLLLTMVHDDAALESILFEGGVLDALPKDATHVSMSSISVALAERLEDEHTQRQQGFVGSPVFGRPSVAAEGKLWLVIAGEQGALDKATPVLEVFSRGISVVGARPNLAHAVKLGGNFLITAMIASLSESVTYSEAYGIDPALFLETINDALFQSPLYANYSKVMLHPPEEVAASVEMGAKDTRLFREAAKERAMRTPLADIFQQQLNTAVRAGEGDRDWAAGYLKLVRDEAKGLEEV